MLDPGAASAAELKARSVKLPFGDANDLCVFDVDFDGDYDILVTNRSGQAAVFDPKSLEAVWTRKLSDKALTSFAAGDFIGDGSCLLVAAGLDGVVRLVWPGTGEVAAESPAGASVVVPPSTLSANGSPDRIVICDDNGAVRVLSFKDGQLKEDFNVPNAIDPANPLGKLRTPATCADLDGDGTPEIIVGSDGGMIQTVSASGADKRRVYKVPQGETLNTLIATAILPEPLGSAMLHGAGNDFSVLKMTSGEQWLAFREAARASVNGLCSYSISLAPFLGNDQLGIVVSSANTVLTYSVTSDGALLRILQWADAMGTLSPASLVQIKGGKYGIVVSDTAGNLFVHDAADNKEGSKFTGGPADKAFLPCGDLTGAGHGEVVFISKANGTLNIADLGVEIEPQSAPALTIGANFQRTGVSGPSMSKAIAAWKSRFDSAFASRVTSFETAWASGAKSDANAAALALTGMRPQSAEAVAAHGKVHRAGNILKYLLILLIGGGAIAGIGMAGIKTIRRRKQAQQLSDLITSQDYARNVPELEQRLASNPGDSRLLEALSEAYLQTDTRNRKVISVYEQVRKLKSDETKYTLALANAYADAGEDSPEALETYQVALATMQGGRGRIAHVAANALRRKNDLDQAIKYYKLALKEGEAQPEVTVKLAEAFVDSGQFNDKNLPVFEAAVKVKPEDARLAEGYCRCLVAARISDANAASIAAVLLKKKPDSSAGLVLLAKCMLQAGKGAEAAALAEKAYQGNPKDAALLHLLAQAYAAAGRQDDNALKVFKAVATSASADEQPEFMRALALAYVARNEATDDAYSAMRQAAESHPLDERLQTGLAHAATQKSDWPVLIAALERLLAMGRSTPETYSSLASAYAVTESVTPEAERVYREALKLDPANRELLRSMTRIIMSGGRMDADAVLFLEKLLQLEPVSAAIGSYLARAYVRNGRFDDATRLAKLLLDHSPDNEELKKLLAQASLQTNRIEEAIGQYEELYRSHPNDAEAMLNLADAYAQKQRVDEASAAIYEKALQADPKRATIRAMLARHHSANGRYARGLEEYRQALAADTSLGARVRDDLMIHIAAASERTDLRWMLTDLLIDNNQLPDAITQLDEIFQQDPASLRQVLQGLDRVLAKDSSNLLANLRKGTLLKAQGRFEEARPLLERAHAINPGNAEAASEIRDLYQTLLQESDDVKLRFELGRVNYALQDFDAAIGQFQRTAQDFRFENDSIKMLGLCFVGKGMLEFALQEFKKLVIDDEMKEILYDLAQRYEMKNDVVGAKQVYRELYRADINYKNVKQKFDMLAGNTSDPLALERSSLMTQLSEKARRRYELVEELGRGAMGIVYKARDNELDEFVALKILPDNLSQNPEAVARFRSEARSARKLAHPNIVRIHDIGEEMGRKYISMEYVTGGDLKHHFRTTRGGKLDPKEIVAIMIPIANAMDYAHSLQIVHRDIKPANIMLDDQGNPKVSDFGIAKMLEKTSETIAGAIIGTPLYMSPEQVQGLNVDHRADIYALGIMMYEFANGRPPFIEGDLAYQHIHVVPKPIEGIPDVLNDIILKCLEKSRDKRWARAAEIQKALENSGIL